LYGPVQKKQLLVIGGGTAVRKGGDGPNFGENINSDLGRDVYVLELETMEWSRPHLTGLVIEPRSSATACLFNGKIFVIGGYGGDEKFNDISILRMGRPITHVRLELERYTQEMHKIFNNDIKAQVAQELCDGALEHLNKLIDVIKKF